MVVGVEHVIRIIYHAKLFLLGMYHHGYFILCHNIHVLFLSPQSSLFNSGLVLETPPRKPRTHQCGEWTHSHWFAEVVRNSQWFLLGARAFYGGPYFGTLSLSI